MTYQLLKDLLLAEPILKYPDPNKPYVLYTDASSMHGHVSLHRNMNMKLKVKLRRYIIQLHMLVDYLRVVKLIGLHSLKEAYAIYRSVRKLTYYLEDADVLLRSDHLPLKKFLERTH